MARSARKKTRTTAPARAAFHPARRVWKLEDAKARLSEVIQLALSEGPQRVTRRGRPAVLIIADSEVEQPTLSPDDPYAGWADELRGYISDDTDLMAIIGPRDRRDRGSRHNPIARLLRQK